MTRVKKFKYTDLHYVHWYYWEVKKRTQLYVHSLHGLF
jgi:hypothetical protein